jgi:hypothetical protein
MTNRLDLSISERFAFASGHEFGSVGAYEGLVGRAHFAIDPSAAAQHSVTDLDKAPTDAAGLVHFTGDFSILRPIDPARGNRRLFFDYGNRGNSGCCNSSTMPRPRTTRAAWRMPATVF